MSEKIIHNWEFCCIVFQYVTFELPSDHWGQDVFSITINSKTWVLCFGCS